MAHFLHSVLEMGKVSVLDLISPGLDVVFSRFRGFSFTITQRSYNWLSFCPLIQRGMRVTPLGFCLRVIVNEKTLNFEKTTSSVLSILLLIYAFLEMSRFAVFCLYVYIVYYTSTTCSNFLKFSPNLRLNRSLQWGKLFKVQVEIHKVEI